MRLRLIPPYKFMRPVTCFFSACMRRLLEVMSPFVGDPAAALLPGNGRKDMSPFPA
jgi:hypothetical protein